MNFSFQSAASAKCANNVRDIHTNAAQEIKANHSVRQHASYYIYRLARSKGFRLQDSGNRTITDVPKQSGDVRTSWATPVNHLIIGSSYTHEMFLPQLHGQIRGVVSSLWVDPLPVDNLTTTASFASAWFRIEHLNTIILLITTTSHPISLAEFHHDS